MDQSRILTIDEINTVIASANQRYHNNRMNLILFRLATCCGLRASEIAGLKMADMVLQPVKPYLVVQGKGNKTRRVPLHWDAGTLAALSLWKEAHSDQEYVLQTRTGKPLDRSAVRKRFINVCAVLNRESITVHDGRHTFCSLALAGGRSLSEVRDAAGHSNVSTTNIYLHSVDSGEVGNLFA